MRLNVNHVAEIYVTEQRQRAKNRTRNRLMFCDVCGGTARNIFRDFNMAGCTDIETYRQTNDSETDSGDTEIVGAVLERGEAAESDDYSHIVQPYRFGPYLAMPGGVDSAIAGDDAN